MKNNVYIYNQFSKLDSITYNHSIRVQALAIEVEKYYGMDDDVLSNAAMVHDIGKIYISSKILDKVGKLTTLEREMIDLHPYIGYKLLKEMCIDEDICNIVLYHHGAAPPILSEIEMCTKNEIMDKALMLHTIDTFEALTSDRPYHRGYPAFEALGIMKNEVGHHPDVLKYLTTMAEESKNKVTNSVVRRGNLLG